MSMERVKKVGKGWPVGYSHPWNLRKQVEVKLKVVPQPLSRGLFCSMKNTGKSGFLSLKGEKMHPDTSQSIRLRHVPAALNYYHASISRFITGKWHYHNKYSSVW